MQFWHIVKHFRHARRELYTLDPYQAIRGCARVALCFYCPDRFGWTRLPLMLHSGVCRFGTVFLIMQPFTRSDYRATLILWRLNEHQTWPPPQAPQLSSSAQFTRYWSCNANVASNGNQLGFAFYCVKVFSNL